MANKRILQGTVLDRDTEERYEGATIRFQKKTTKAEEPSTPVFINSDDDGDFSFDISDEKKFPAGEYILYAFSPLAQGQSVSVTLETKKSPTPLEVKLVNNRSVSDLAGYIFFALLTILLIGVGYFYYQLHEKVPNPLNHDLSELVILAKNQVPDKANIDSNSHVIRTLSTMDSIAILSLKASGKRSQENKRIVTEFLFQAKNAAVNNQKEELTQLLESLEKYFKNPPGAFFWNTKPFLLWEVFFWAFFATLLRLLVNTGYYVSRKQFYGNSIIHKLSLMLSIPILAILISFILSFLNFSLAIGELQLKLDLSDPIVSILIATLIGFAPWEAWDFMRSLADTLFKRLGNVLNASKKD